MGVYIKGMEMPTSCCQCPVNMYLCKRGYEYLLEHPALYDERADDCPLVPVPPHGRLIDADALEKDFASLIPWAIDNEIDTAYTDGLTSGYNALVNAPTIIPAEEGE